MIIMNDHDLWEKLKTETRPIVIYGISDAAEKIAGILESNGCKISGVMASDGFVRDRDFLGHKLKSMSQLEAEFLSDGERSTKGDFIILLCFGSHRADVIDNIKSIAKKHDLYAPDLPVIGSGLFDYDYYKNHKNDFDKLNAILADDQSRKVLENTIQYKLSGKLDFLFDCETPEEEGWLLAIGNSTNHCKSLLDLGAYTGDTADLFARLVPDYKFIYAVEPESRNFRKLKEYADGWRNIFCFNLGIGDRSEIVAFPKGNGRGSTSKKTTPVEFTSVDELIKGKNTDDLLIKMDLEGWECKAIDGAQKIISELHPNLYIAAYHRLDDLLEIPKKVLSLNPDYKLYLRHSPCIPAWEMNYIFVDS